MCGSLDSMQNRDEAAIRKQVRDLLLRNSFEGYSKFLEDNYSYIQPSASRYPFQYWWDTCFHIFMLTDLGELDLAKKELQSLFAQQEANGFVGHMIFWKRVLPTTWRDVFQARPSLQQFRPHMSALIQPPFVAQALKRIHEEDGDGEFVQYMLPKLHAYFDWLAENRDFDNDGLITLISPFESGMDWSPVFDPVVGHSGPANALLFLRVVSVDLRNFIRRYDLKEIYKAGYFLVKDVGYNSAYGLDLHTMFELCKLMGDKQRAQSYLSRYKQVVQRLLEICYDEESEAFYNVAGKTNQKIKVLTAATFFPLVFADIIPEEVAQAVYKRHLFNNDEFWTEYPVPSVSQREAAFDPGDSRYIWRGPTWIVFNWFLYRCLLARGNTAEADKILHTVWDLIIQSGFREYYNPFTGEGYGAKGFTWSGLIVDMLRIKRAVEKAQKKTTRTIKLVGKHRHQKTK
jgi:hypothetical protein